MNVFETRASGATTKYQRLLACQDHPQFCNPSILPGVRQWHGNQLVSFSTIFSMQNVRSLHRALLLATLGTVYALAVVAFRKYHWEFEQPELVPNNFGMIVAAHNFLESLLLSFYLQICYGLLREYRDHIRAAQGHIEDLSLAVSMYLVPGAGPSEHAADALAHALVAVWDAALRIQPEMPQTATTALSVLLTREESSALSAQSRLPYLWCIASLKQGVAAGTLHDDVVMDKVLESISGLQRSLSSVETLQEDNGGIAFDYSSFLSFSTICALIEVPWAFILPEDDTMAFIVVGMAQFVTTMGYLGVLEMCRGHANPFCTQALWCLKSEPLINMTTIALQCHQSTATLVPHWRDRNLQTSTTVKAST